MKIGIYNIDCFKLYISTHPNMYSLSKFFRKKGKDQLYKNSLASEIKESKIPQVGTVDESTAFL